MTTIDHIPTPPDFRLDRVEVDGCAVRFIFVAGTEAEAIRIANAFRDDADKIRPAMADTANKGATT